VSAEQSPDAWLATYRDGSQGGVLADEVDTLAPYLNHAEPLYTLANAARALAVDDEAMEAVRLRIEDELVEWRDSMRFMARRNGFTIANRDGSRSGIVRFGTEIGFRIGLSFLADRAEAGK
jgi:hypothetical protein